MTRNSQSPQIRGNMMEKINKFTDVMVKNLQPSEKLREYTEGNGFCLRVTPKGKKAWVYRYKINYQSKRFTVGYYPSLSIAEARKAVSDAGVLKDKGIDPAQDKKDREEAEAKEQAKEKLTIEWLANDFYTGYIEKNRKVPGQIKQQIDADIIPALGQYKIDEITTLQITQALKTIVARGANVHANKVLSTIKQMFTYAVSMGVTERHPAILIKSKNIGGDEQPKKRKLSLQEIKLIWQWLGINKNHRLHPATVLALKILLLTGARSGELRLAEWSEIDFDNSMWTIPANKYKTGVEHKVYLTEFTIQHLKELKDLSDDDCKWVLPSPKENTKPLTDKALPRAVKRIEGRIKDIDGKLLIAEPWTPHDLRRTFRTQLGELGVLPHIAEKTLGHKPPKIEGTYDTGEYLPERKKALQQWSDKIESLVTNSNVIPLNTKSNKG